MRMNKTFVLPEPVADLTHRRTARIQYFLRIKIHVYVNILLALQIRYGGSELLVGRPVILFPVREMRMDAGLMSAKPDSNKLFLGDVPEQHRTTRDATCHLLPAISQNAGDGIQPRRT